MSEHKSSKCKKSQVKTCKTSVKCGKVKVPCPSELRNFYDTKIVDLTTLIGNGSTTPYQIDKSNYNIIFTSSASKNIFVQLPLDPKDGVVYRIGSAFDRNVVGTLNLFIQQQGVSPNLAFEQASTAVGTQYAAYFIEFVPFRLQTGIVTWLHTAQSTPP